MLNFIYVLKTPKLYIMYRKLIPALLLLGGSMVALAQPTLTAPTINPILGDQFTIVNCDTTGVSPLSGGASQVWDFSSLPGPYTKDTLRAWPPYWTSHASLFPSSNLAMATITSSPTSVDIYDIATSTAFSQDGLYYNSSSQYAQYSDPMDILEYPFSYLDSFHDNYAGSILFLGTIPASETGTIHVQFDGYGTLTLPGAINYSNVARVHSIQSYTDHASLFSIDTTASYQLETYAWYSPGYHNALLSIVTGTGVGGYFKAVSYSANQDQSHENVSSIVTADAALELFPNPVKSKLNIRYTTANLQDVRISLIDIIGREVAVITDQVTRGDQNISYNTNGVPKGLYLVRCQSGTEITTRKVEIQ